MEINTYLNSKILTRATARFIPLVLAMLIGVSCATDIIKGRPPFISISGMSLVDDKLSADFDIRNQNGVPMTIDRIDLTVTVNNVELASDHRDLDLTIGANSAEAVHVDELPDDDTRSLLDSLGGGEVKSLAFDLNGRVHTLEDDYLSFEQKGYLYPVPGKPGHFRAAVTQARGLRHDKQF